MIEAAALLDTAELLLEGGDARLGLHPQTQTNKYGCGALPDTELVAFGSSTGSTISARGFAAARTLHQRLFAATVPTAADYRAELERVRLELNLLCGLDTSAGVASIFAASGTDLHLLCVQLLAAGQTSPLHIIMMEGSETGSGVAPALHGRHFSDHAALGGQVSSGTALEHMLPVMVSSIALRNSDGSKRTLSQIDAQTDALVATSVALGQQVLLIMIDVSKTGLIAPSPRFIAELRERFPTEVDILVDACQFRLSNTTLQAYLALGCMVALTGSKFLTGPVFCGILQIPPNLATRLARQHLPQALADYSARAEWPTDWQAGAALCDVVNWGLLLRLEAALAELRAFRAVPEAKITAFVQQFSQAMQAAISQRPCFELMAEQRLDRSPVSTFADWDQIPTIFPFILKHASGRPLSRVDTELIYRRLQEPLILSHADSLSPKVAARRYQLGQPVLCGERDGVGLSALRMCASSRLIVEACSHGDFAGQNIIARACEALDKAACLISKLC